MRRPYKGEFESYSYQDKWHRLGYEHIGWLTFGPGFADSPKDFVRPNGNALVWRRAILKYIEPLKKTDEYKDRDLRVVMAVGYWRDLYPFVYEVFGKIKKVGTVVSSGEER
ncbi:MAG: hypothetical protein AUJ71_03965 [Candidatus Omnitrophica bacterium CG1_02_49_16]|nr:MAG: hypothetical protein AUJ71_03965 [Candidatus Omnitrophica bacterium CG1_02_49_16]